MMRDNIPHPLGPFPVDLRVSGQQFIVGDFVYLFRPSPIATITMQMASSFSMPCVVSVKSATCFID